MHTFFALWLLALALYLAYWLVRSIAAFREFQQGRAYHVRDGLRIVQDETRRHGQAVADAQAWAAKHHARFDATAHREASEAVSRG